MADGVQGCGGECGVLQVRNMFNLAVHNNTHDQSDLVMSGPDNVSWVQGPRESRRHFNVNRGRSCRMRQPTRTRQSNDVTRQEANHG